MVRYKTVLQLIDGFAGERSTSPAYFQTIAPFCVQLGRQANDLAVQHAPGDADLVFRSLDDAIGLMSRSCAGRDLRELAKRTVDATAALNGVKAICIAERWDSGLC